MWRHIARRAAAIAGCALGLWAVLEVAVRCAVEWPLATDFYGSISRTAVRQEQARWGVRVADGAGWSHLGWIADPERERYRVERGAGGSWEFAGTARFGSFLVRRAGAYRVWAVPRDGSAPRLVGTANARPGPPAATPVRIPRIAGPWRLLFRPRQYGDYVNDHAVYRDAAGRWRLVGITGRGSGDPEQERYFATAVSADFPPPEGMREEAPVARFGDLAWAPHVVRAAGRYYLFWSPHRLHRMVSADGASWSDHRVVLRAPYHKFFRDAMVLEVADGQWLLYATARGRYYSRVDLYQSFDLEGWQYIGPALRTGWGSERNSIVASTESPFVVRYEGRYYLALTYNNDSFFWSLLLLAAKAWFDRASYNETLVFHSDNPYDFGSYRGAARAPTLVARLAAHAPEWIYHPERDQWYITTAGWPWVATLTAGEVAVAPLRWE